MVEFFPVVDFSLGELGMNVQSNAGNEFRRKREWKRLKKDREKDVGGRYLNVLD